MRDPANQRLWESFERNVERDASLREACRRARWGQRSRAVWLLPALILVGVVGLSVFHHEGPPQERAQELSDRDFLRQVQKAIAQERFHSEYLQLLGSQAFRRFRDRQEVAHETTKLLLNLYSQVGQQAEAFPWVAEHLWDDDPEICRYAAIAVKRMDPNWASHAEMAARIRDIESPKEDR